MENAAYHACGVFKNKFSRKAKNALGAQCFWLDIDCGKNKAEEGKGYANKDVALQALDQFQDTYGLPNPTIICSGHGYHVYWRLSEFVSATEWTRVAQLLKVATERSGFIVDGTRTADLASILRPVGTQNRKNALPAPVYVEYEDCEPISLAEFESKLTLFLPPYLENKIISCWFSNNARPLIKRGGIN